MVSLMCLLSASEVLKAIVSLKNNKACSDDMILNEFLEASKNFRS